MLDMDSVYREYVTVVYKFLLSLCYEEDMAEELDQKIQEIVPGRIISVVYFHQGEYLKVTGMVARFDRSSRILQVVNTRISLDDVLKVEV